MHIEFVAVHYDNDYYIGEVVDVLSSEEGIVIFMEQCTIKSNTFAWPAWPKVQSTQKLCFCKWK